MLSSNRSTGHRCDRHHRPSGRPAVLAREPDSGHRDHPGKRHVAGHRRGQCRRRHRRRAAGSCQRARGRPAGRLSPSRRMALRPRARAADLRHPHVQHPQGRAAGRRKPPRAAVLRHALRGFRVLALLLLRRLGAQPELGAAGQLRDPPLRQPRALHWWPVRLPARVEPHHARALRAGGRRSGRRGLPAAERAPGGPGRCAEARRGVASGRHLLDHGRPGHRQAVPRLPRAGPGPGAHAHRQPCHQRDRRGGAYR